MDFLNTANVFHTPSFYATQNKFDPVNSSISANPGKVERHYVSQYGEIPKKGIETLFFYFFKYKGSHLRLFFK